MNELLSERERVESIKLIFVIKFFTLNTSFNIHIRKMQKVISNIDFIELYTQLRKPV